MLSEELSFVPLDETRYFFPPYSDMLSEEFDDEFVFHLFQSSGEEIALP